MYLRYGDPSWDAADASDAPPAVGVVSPAVDAPGVLPEAKALPVEGEQRSSTATPLRPRRRLPGVVLCNVLLHSITEAECVRHICDELAAGRGGMVVTPNLDHLRRYGNDVNFGALVAEAELVVADGMPLVWASRLQGTPLPERVAGSNLISSLSGAAAERGFSIYLLGGAPGTAVGAGEALRARFPALKVVGTYCPPFGFDRDPKQMADIIQSIVAARPDVVYVALGSPKQERLIAKLRHVMPGAWWLGVGNSFSFLCGDVRRAPLWMQNIGMEWAHRLCQEPRRLFKRYLVSGVPFAGVLLGKSALIGVRRRLGEALFGKQQQSVEAAPPVSASSLAGDIHAAPDAAQVSSVPSIGVGLAAAVATAEPARQSVRHALTRDRNAADLAASLTAAPAAEAGDGDESRLARLRALVLLGGSVRPTALSTLTGRSTLDLPLDDDGSVLNHWLAQGIEVAKAVGLERLPVRVMVNHHSYDPASADPKYYGTFRVERDLSEYRGTGGVLRDLANDYDDDDLILVANGRQVLLDPLPALATWLARVGGDVSVVAHADGTPSGLMLVRCKALRLINDTGFCDMKEQALPRIAQQFDVRVAERRRPTGLPVRSLEDYILALRCYHRRRAGKPASVDPLAEDWSSSFSLVEPGAVVDPSARLHDSVVLRGATVEPGAVLVRSVIAADGVVRHDKTAVDQIICGATERHARRRRRRNDTRGRASRATVTTTGNALTELRA